MTDLRKAAEMALEALELSQNGMNECYEDTGFDFANEQYEVEQAIQALRQALAQKQEPVAWMDKYGDVLPAYVVDGKGLRNIPLYTAPPKREWVGLTDAEFMVIERKYSLSTRVGLEYFKDELEAKLKEKNT